MLRRFLLLICLFSSVVGTVRPSTLEQQRSAFSARLNAALARPFSEEVRTYVLPTLQYGSIAALLLSTIIHAFRSDEFKEVTQDREHLTECLKLIGHRWTEEQRKAADEALKKIGDRVYVKKRSCRRWKLAQFYSFVIGCVAWAVTYLGDNQNWWCSKERSHVAKVCGLVANQEAYEAVSRCFQGRAIPVYDSEIVATNRDGHCLFTSFKEQLSESEKAQFSVYDLRSRAVERVGDAHKQEAAYLGVVWASLDAVGRIEALQTVEAYTKLLGDYGDEIRAFLNMRNHDGSLMNPVLAHLRDEEGNLQQCTDMAPNDFIDAYKIWMGKSNAWGGHPEIKALTSFFDTTTYVLDHRKDGYVLSDVHGSGARKVVLLRKSNHYEGWRLPGPISK